MSARVISPISGLGTELFLLKHLPRKVLGLSELNRAERGVVGLLHINRLLDAERP